MCVAGIAAFVLQQVSLAEGFLATSVATVSVSNPIVSIVIGILLFDERLSDPTWHKVVAFAGMALGAIGAIAIAAAREHGKVADDGVGDAVPGPAQVTESRT
jgi:hypothetical protein